MASNPNVEISVEELFSMLSGTEGITGVITASKLSQFLNSLHINADEMLSDIMEFITEGASDTIDFRQFKKFMEIVTLSPGENPIQDHYRPNFEDYNRASKLAFTAFDRDGDRKINVDDLRALLAEQEFSKADEASVIDDVQNLTDADLLAYIYAVDPEKQTYISRAAFHNMMQGAASLERKPTQEVEEADEF